MERLLKWGGAALVGLAGLVALALAAVYGATEYRIRKTYEISPAALAVRSTPESIARGKHIATVRGCVDCHTASLGGNTFLDEAPVARLFASNLTSGRGGVGRTYTDADWVRAIRHGVGPGGKPLLFMPSHEFNVISDEDLAALIAYLKSIPPVDNAPRKNSVGPIGRILFLSGKVNLLPAEGIDHRERHKTAPVPGPTAEYGKYMASGCIGCHGDNFSGGPIPGAPPSFPAARNITPDDATGIGTWTEQDFFNAMRNGKRPDGTELRPEMPWKLTAQMTNDEIRALWVYLQSVPARPYGNR